MISKTTRNQVLLLSLLFVPCLSFTIRQIPTPGIFKNYQISSRPSSPGEYSLQMIGNNFFDAGKSTNVGKSISVGRSNADKSNKLVDANGIEYTVGCTVMLTKESKSYSSPKKGWGKFSDVDNTFLPLDVNGEREIPRSDKCLVLPSGIRGTVKRVYDISELKAVHPIQVTFTSGESLGGDYIPPVNLLMHFATQEVEVVSE